MALSKSFWSLRRGSVGDLTFTRSASGEQVTRQKVTTMKNPKTVPQNLQRMQFAGVAKMRALLNSIVNHSFESENPKLLSLSEFTKRNLQASLTPEMVAQVTGGNRPDWEEVIPIAGADGQMLPFSAIVADGQLPSRDSLVRFTSGRVLSLTDGAIGYVPDEGEDIPTWSALLASSGLQVGDYLTFLLVVNDWSGGDDLRWEDFKFTWIRFTLKPQSDAWNQSATIASMSDVFDIVQGGDIVPVAYGMLTVNGLSDSEVHLGVYYEGDFNVIAWTGIIHSRDTSTTKMRSFERLQPVTQVAPGAASAMESLWLSMLNSWEIGDAYILDGGASTYAEFSPEDYYTYRESSNHISPRPVPPQSE